MFIQNGYITVHVSVIISLFAAVLVVWVILVMRVSEQEKRMSILRLLRACPEGMPALEIRRICRMSNGDAYFVLRHLEDKGCVDHMTDTRDGCALPVHVYSITTEGEEYLTRHD